MYGPADYRNPLENFDLVADSHKGIVKAAMIHVFREKSCDKHVIVHRKPDVKVTVTRAFKEGSFVLSALTPSVTTVKAKGFKHSFICERSSTVSLGELFEHKGDSVIGLLKHALVFPKPTVSHAGFPQKDADSSFIVAYWATQTTEDVEKANLEKSVIPVPVKIGGKAVTVDVPVFKNKKALVNGDEVIVHSRKHAAEAPSVQDAQPAKKGKGSGKGKGRGKGSGKA